MTQAMRIFWGVLLYCFAIHFMTRSFAASSYIDTSMWADQIRFLLTDDQQMFDFYRAYGHPGTTIVGLGSLFHLLFGLSYLESVILSISAIVSMAAAVCAVLCFLLQRESLWWLSTAFLLTFSRFFVAATPPTAVALPFALLMVLGGCWLWQYQSEQKRWPFFLWGATVGLSAATRLDATILVALPTLMSLCYRHRSPVLFPVVAGAAVSFFVADPFLWFMPLQHLTDLAAKFFIHYDQFQSRTVIPLRDLLGSTSLGLLGVASWLILSRSKRSGGVVPPLIMNSFLATTVMASLIILTSSFQDVRYFYPLLIVWEAFLPLFLWQWLDPAQSGAGPSTRRGAFVTWCVLGGFLLLETLAYLTIFPW